MDPQTPSPPETTLSDLQARLVAAAHAVGLPAADAPHLTGNVFLGGEGSEAARLKVSDLSHPVRALQLGRYAILLAMLPERPSLEAVTEALRRFRNQCAIARSYLSANEALDLQGVLVGPRGSEPMDEWQPLALLLERDDRVAQVRMAASGEGNGGRRELCRSGQTNVPSATLGKRRYLYNDGARQPQSRRSDVGQVSAA
jgi:hypothetical protein